MLGEFLPAPPADGNPIREDEINRKTIGIIYPPLDIRNIVDKTCHFVAKNGPAEEFETRIIGIANNQGNAKFNFLRASDPYHAYYQYRLSSYLLS